MKKTIILTALITCVLLVNAQKQANYWYFGSNAGLSFAMGPPAPLTNGALNTGEGCSSISTAAGTLEFYTDGRYVYNRNHGQMPNGSDLLGHSSSTQSAIIVPKPGTTTQYYIFTVDAADNGLANGLCYTLVDMTLNDGLGDVVTTEKNISLVPLACEKVTAVGHSDGQTFWVITKKWGNADFYAYRITYDGVNTTPVISTTGPLLIGNIGQASKGYLKVSPDGTLIASANNTAFNVGIYNFDNSTGVITHLVTDENYTNPGGFDPGGPYGVEFSPNSKRLYIGEWKANRRIFQYDLSSGDPTTIVNSRIVAASVGQSSDPIGALQLGPDNRLYIARYESPYLSRINTPNTLGVDCGFVENALDLANRQCRYGLPPFIQSFFFLSADFYWDEPACDGNLIQFQTSASDVPDSVKWTFPDGSHSELMDPTYLFPGPGLYGVGLLVYIYGQSKSVSHFIRIHPKTEMALGNDTAICRNEAFFIDPGTYHSYLWQNGSTSQTILADTSGWYWCEVGNEWGCTAIDSMYVTVNPNPEITAGPDLTVPEGTTAFIMGTVTGNPTDYTYHWEPASLLVNPNVLQAITIPMTTTTFFTLTTTNINTGCTSEDQMLLTVTGGVLSCFISASPGELCLGGQTHLQAQAYGGTGNYTYSWTSDPPGFASTLRDPVVAPGQTTTYYLSVNDGETIVNRDVSITVHPLPLPDAGQDQMITYGTPTTLQGNVTQGTGPYTYQWEPSDKLVSANVQYPLTLNLYESTVFSLYVTDQGTGCVCVQPDFVTVSMAGDALSAHPAAQPDTVCFGSSSHLFTLAGGGTNNYTYQWTSDPPGFTSNLANPEVSPSQTTVYTVSVSDGFNSTTAGVTITVNPIPQISLLPVGDPRVQIISPTEIGICVFDTITLDAGNTGYSFFWSNGSLDQTISIQTSGLSFDFQEFEVAVTDPATGCTSTSEIAAYFTFLNCSYGIDDKDFSNGLQVYPNPSGDGLFNFSIEGLKGETALEVYTSQGMLNHKEIISLLPGRTFSSVLDLSGNSSGVYYLKLSNQEAVIVKKMIIQLQ
ncbi:MAG: T9SS type A sorting domain-containing protein [Bacteroidales bacterium]|nr:T9SS type A sorting domain-containing protein [Bacteroidales bacterium]